MTFDELKNRLDELAEELISDATETNARTFGLDERAGHQLWLTEAQDAIVVAKQYDGSLQYYGGFEYVDKECRLECGDYVFYSSEDSRVKDHIDIAIDALEPDDSEKPDPTPEDIAASKADLYNDQRICDEE